MSSLERIEITIGAEVTVRGLPPHLESKLIEANSFPNPEYARREGLGLWLGDTPKALELYRRTDGGLIVPRGTFPVVARLCSDHGLRFEVEDRTVCPPLGLDLSAGELYPYQQKAVDKLLQYPTGMLEAPTGCGKTCMLLTALARLGTSALIIVHTKELFAQMSERCRTWLGIEPGALGAGKWDVQPISVAMIQTLARRDLSTIANTFGAVLIDEAHHSPARSWAALLDQLPARYRYGFTATAFRKDGLGKLMFRSIGGITAKVSRAEVESAGAIVAPDIQTVGTNFAYTLQDATGWGEMITALVQDDDRNRLIAREISSRLRPERRALVLSDRISHVHRLAALLEELNPTVLTGKLSKSDREAAMGAVRAGARLTIATSSLLGEGVDVPGWDLLVMATPMAGGPRTLQAVGRVSRAAPGKREATVVDFVDRRVPALVQAHRARERLYARS